MEVTLECGQPHPEMSDVVRTITKVFIGLDESSKANYAHWNSYLAERSKKVDKDTPGRWGDSLRQRRAGSGDPCYRLGRCMRRTQVIAK